MLLVAFNGEENILSNFFPCELNIYGVTHKSAEHAFQYLKDVRCGGMDGVKLIQEAKAARSVNRLGDKIGSNEQWKLKNQS